jgi:hypothetical protein
MDEQNVETELGHDSWCGSIAVAEAGLPILLACLRRSFEFGWVGIPNICPVSIASHSGLSGNCCWGIGVPGESAARLWAFRAWSVCRSGSLGRQVLVGVKSHDVRGSGGVGSRFGVECMAASSSSARLLCGKIN